MTAAEAETAIPVCCVMCLTVPGDPAALRNWGDYRPYWLCVDRDACLDRATAAQHAAGDALMGKQDTGTSAPGTAPATSAPARPRAGEGQQDTVPGAEDDEPAPQEELPLEPLPEPAVCGLVSHDGQPCGLEPGHDPATHGPAGDGAA